MVSDDWVQYNFLYIFTFRIEDSLAVFLIACNLDLEGGEGQIAKGTLKNFKNIFVHNARMANGEEEGGIPFLNVP